MARPVVAHTILRSDSVQAIAVPYAIIGADLGSDDGSSSIFSINPSPILSPEIAEANVPTITDIATTSDGATYFVAWDSLDLATLYALDFEAQLRIKIGTGTGIEGVNALVAESHASFLGATTTGDLVRIDRASGLGSRIGSLGAGWVSSGDLAFDLAGATLYAALCQSTCSGIDFLATVDPVTGVASIIGSTGHSNVFGLVMLSSGVLIAVANGDAFQQPVLLEINPQTAQASVIGSLSTFNGMGGLSFYPRVFRDSFE